MTRSVRAFYIPLTLALVSSTAHAAGSFVPDLGAQAMPRAGAVVASGDDLSAFWYNPANLAQQPGVRLQADVSLVLRTVNWQREGNYRAVSNQGGTVPIPGVYAGYVFDKPRIFLGLGVYAPNNAPLKMPANGPQRYTAITSSSFVFYIQLAAAWEPLPWLRIGGGLVATSMVLDQSLALNLGLGAPEDPDFDVVAALSGAQHFIMNGTGGVWVKPGAGFEIGASFMPPRNIVVDGKLTITPSKALASIVAINGDKTRFTLTLPAFVRAGVAWRWRELLALEAGFVYEGWSAYGSITMAPQNVSYSIAGGEETAVPEMKLVRNFRDSWSFRTGAEVRPLPWLHLRAGYYFEPGAVANESISVAANDVQKHGLCVGAGFDVWKLRISAGYSHAFFAVHDVTNSSQRSLDPLHPDGGTVVGNGRYQFAYDVFSLGVAVRL